MEQRNNRNQNGQSMTASNVPTKRLSNSPNQSSYRYQQKQQQQQQQQQHQQQHQLQTNEMNSPVSQHEELIQFNYESWSKIISQGSHGGPRPVYYKSAGPSNALDGFRPFDLEQYWGRRTVQNLQQCSRVHQ